VKYLKRVSLISIADMTQNGEKDISTCFGPPTPPLNLLSPTNQPSDHDIETLISAYLASTSNPKVHTLEDIITFNTSHAATQLPPDYSSQAGLLRAARTTMPPETYHDTVAHARHAARDLGIDKTLRENDVDVLIGPADGPLFAVAAAAGYPIGTLPLSCLERNGRPFGCVCLAGVGREDIVLIVMGGWERMVGGRKEPVMRW